MSNKPNDIDVFVALVSHMNSSQSMERAKQKFCIVVMLAATVFSLQNKCRGGGEKMSKLTRPFKHYGRFFSLILIEIVVLVLLYRPSIAMAQVGLYHLFEIQVANSKAYSNPFDFRVVELQADFIAPSGKEHSYFGFYDGDGNGGLVGNVWKLRFMPNEVGLWSYSYSWTDGTPGESGTFEVVDRGLPGPLRVATDNPWFFENARGNQFHWRGYSLHLYLHWGYGRGIYSNDAWADLRDKIIKKVADRGYNAVMLAWPVFTKSGWPAEDDNDTHHFWRQNGSTLDFTRYYIPQWKEVEETLKVAAANEVYVFQFLALVDQYTDRPNDDEMTAYLRYMAARLGPYWNNFGYSATWEYHDIWSDAYETSVMNRLHGNLNNLPIAPLLTVHDHSDNTFSGWLDFSMRQLPSTTISTGNIHGGGKQGGVGSAFLDSPILGSEDIWEIGGSLPDNGTEVRRGAWGLQMAGVMPVYMEDTGTSKQFNGDGEDDIRRMLDFFYSKTRYRQYQQLNQLVSRSARQIASGITGEEYLVYDEDGGSITIDLSGASPADSFSVLWFDPKTGTDQSGGTVSGGVAQTLSSPFSGDSVLLLVRLSTGNNPPSAPTGLHIINVS
jgi:hypothetical protein